MGGKKNKKILNWFGQVIRMKQWQIKVFEAKIVGKRKRGRLKDKITAKRRNKKEKRKRTKWNKNSSQRSEKQQINGGAKKAEEDKYAYCYRLIVGPLNILDYQLHKLEFTVLDHLELLQHFQFISWWNVCCTLI